MQYEPICRQFKIEGEITSCAPYGNGHINDTFLVCCQSGERQRRYILQRMNARVFTRPDQVMSNIERVTGYLEKIAEDPRNVMHLVYAADGGSYYVDAAGDYWRMYDFVEDSLCLQKPESPADFYESAVAFGRFQAQLSQFPAEQLYETIPDFHNTPKRYADFKKAVAEDVMGRAAGVEAEIAFINEREAFYSILIHANRAGKLPLRVTHNDTKINNVLLDAATHQALCVIDLDTIMPGFSVTDFGDSIRFGANTAAEDEQDLSKVDIDLTLFQDYAKGYISGCGGALTVDELLLMPAGAKMMTIECGMRFLTDYLQGDTYFKTAYAEHNLVRCRTQLRLVEKMEQHWDEMAQAIKALL